MTKLIEQNIETGEIIERDMTADELAQFEADQAKSQAAIDAAEVKKAAKNALLEKLGLTQEEAKLLLS